VRRSARDRTDGGGGGGGVVVQMGAPCIDRRRRVAAPRRAAPRRTAPAGYQSVG